MERLIEMYNFLILSNPSHNYTITHRSTGQLYFILNKNGDFHIMSVDCTDIIRYPSLSKGLEYLEWVCDPRKLILIVFLLIRRKNRNSDCPISKLPKELLFYILDWLNLPKLRQSNFSV